MNRGINTAAGPWFNINVLPEDRDAIYLAVNTQGEDKCMSRERERDIEKLLADRVKALGGVSYKFTSPGNDGVPDRIVIFPGGDIWFIELKTEQGVLSRIQGYQQNRLLKKGCKVRTLYGGADVNLWIKDAALMNGQITEAYMRMQK